MRPIASRAHGIFRHLIVRPRHLEKRCELFITSLAIGGVRSVVGENVCKARWTLEEGRCDVDSGKDKGEKKGKERDRERERKKKEIIT